MLKNKESPKEKKKKKKEKKRKNAALSDKDKLDYSKYS